MDEGILEDEAALADDKRLPSLDVAGTKNLT
jgi:hypothetical protein